jgi:hypothetical protein
LAKAVVPAGFMPNDGMTAMVICSGMGEKTVMLPADQDSPADHDGKVEACAYHLAALQKIIPVVLPALPVASNPQIPHSVVLVSRTAQQPPIRDISSRGPPLLV